jgi:beta-glucosidase
MLKYKELVGRLTEVQKMLILSDISSLSRKEFGRFGLAALKVGYVEDYIRYIYPSSSILANSWSTELINSVARDTVSAMYKDGVELAILPSPKVKINPFRSALSEDPVLAASLSREYLKAAQLKGIASCVNGYSVEKDEISWMDSEPDERVIREYWVKPYSDAISGAGCAAVISNNLSSGKYKDRNIELIENAADISAPFSVCEAASEHDTVSLISRGIICLRSSGVAIESALRRYEELKRSVDKGEIGEHELCEEIATGNAISPDTLDEAVDRVLSFITYCKEVKSGEINGDAVQERLAERAVRESAVLLKNKNKLLPVSKKETIFVIGDVRNADGECVAETCAKNLKDRGYDCIGWARGYEMEKDRSEMYLGEAYNLSEKADKVVLLLGRDESRERDIIRSKNLELPANQVALAHKLSVRGKNVIAVVSSEYGFDISPLEDFDALMVMGLATKYSAKALTDIVVGEFSPTGKLSGTLYRNTNSSFSKQAYYMKKGSSRAGVFVGYRYYDTAECDVGFPFGHGIGFSRFSYSRYAAATCPFT